MQATQTVSAPSAPLQFSKPHIAVEIETITQAEIRELIEFRNLREQLEERISGIEADLKTRLESGAAVESGVHVAKLAEHFRRSPSWKLIVIRLASRLGLDGEGYAANVLTHTKPTRTVSVEVR